MQALTGQIQKINRLSGQTKKINRLSGQLITPRAAPGGDEFKDVYIDVLTEKFSESLPMTFSTTAEALEDYCIYGNDGGVGDLVESGYLIPINISGNTINITLDQPLYFDDVLTMADTGVTIPTVIGSNTLTVGTTVQPAAVQVKYQS